MNKLDSKEYIASRFRQSFDEEINIVDPSGLSTILSMAIEGRTNKLIKSENILPLVLKRTNGASMISFLEMKHIILELGFKSTAYTPAILPEMRHSKKIFAITTDFGKQFLILVGEEDGVMYMIYPDQKVCLLDSNTFFKEFSPPAIMLINN